MTSYYSIITSKMRKSLRLIVCLLCVYNSLYSQFQWEHTGGPEGLGDCTPFYNKDFAFLYDNYTLFRTSDGQSWKVINSTSGGNIVVSNERISIYTEQNMGVDQPKQIQFQLSKDNGDTWSNAGVPSEAYYHFNQVMLCSHGIYFKAGEKLYRSQTDGQSWKQISYDSIAFSSIFAADDRVFGRNSDKIFEFNPQSGKWVFSWNMPVQDGILEAIYIRDLNIIVKSANKFYSSLNKGEVWITFATQSTQISHMIEKDNKVYFQSGNFIRYTDNGGFSWKSIFLNAQYKNMTLIKDKFLLFSAKDGCYLFDDSSNSYLPANNGLHSSGIRKLWAGDNMIWAQLYSDNSVHKLDVFSGEWSDSGFPKSVFPNLTYLVSESGYFLDENISSGEIFLYTNQGADWDTLNLPFNQPHNVDNFFWIGDYIYVQGSFNQKYISKDFGVTWLEISRYLTSGVVFKDQIWAIEYNGKLIVSKDDVNSWEEVDNIPVGLRSLYATEDRLFLLTASGNQAFLYSSVDGIEWEFSGDGLGINEIRPGFNDVVNLKKFNGNYYLQTERSLFNSEDNGRSWERLLNYLYYTIALLNDSVYVGITNGGGVLKSPLPQLGRQMARGSIFQDIDGNGIKDTNERYMADVQIMMSTNEFPQKNYFTLSNQEGNFEIRPSYESNDTLRPNLISEYIESIGPPFYITHDSIDSYDFAVRFRPKITDGSISGTYNRLPGSGKNINIHLQYQNIGTAPFSGVVSLKMDPAFNFIQSTPPPTAINNDSLIWRFEDLGMLDKKQILIEGKLSFFLATDSLIKSYAQIVPEGADENLSDNYTIIEDKVSSNSNTFYGKKVNPEVGMTEAQMKEGKELEYTIFFQNPSDVGVKDFQISDALAPELDVKTIRIIGSSHAITKWELLPSRILRVHFENANLPPANPSAYEVQGFFKFGIRIRKDNYPNFYFNNIASIIFDDRIVGYTNSVQTRWIEEVITGTNEVLTNLPSKLSIIPNPASHNCFLSTNGRMKGAGTIRIFNANGRALSSQQLQDLSLDIEIQTAQLSNGFYLITAEGSEGIMHGKLIIQK
jgi:hypothetical protein